MKPHKVIYDTDPGVDDALAFMFQALHPDIELLGVTSVFGNATIDTTTRNALYLTARFAPAVSVARGAAAPLKRAAPKPVSAIHGSNGLGDIVLEPCDATPLDARSAHRFMIDTVRAHPGEITLIAVGPLTNLALALAEDPHIATLVKHVIVMGGAFGVDGAYGNVTPAAEANMWGDPDAADSVFSAAWPLTIVGLDVTQKTVMTTEYLAAIRDQGGQTGRFIWDVSRFYEHFHRTQVQVAGIYTHDPSAVAYLLAPHLYTTRAGSVRVLTEGMACGQTIQKPARMRIAAPAWDNRPACEVCLNVDVPAVLDLYARTICGTLTISR